MFECNGCIGVDIYIYFYFFVYFRYFLFGLEFLDDVIVVFEVKVGNFEWVSLSDIVLIGKVVCDLMCRYCFDIVDVFEEFFKFCFDMGLGFSMVESVM